VTLWLPKQLLRGWTSSLERNKSATKNDFGF
jgi:hypothetical protein